MDKKEILAEPEKYNVFYEDKLVVALLHPEPISLGHILIFPRDEVNDETFLHLFDVSNACATMLFETLGLHGTNIIVHDGENSDSFIDNYCFEVVGRTSEDGINLLWEPGKPGDLATVASKIKDKTFFIGKKVSEVKEVTTEEISDDSENYMIKHLRHLS